MARGIARIVDGTQRRKARCLAGGRAFGVILTLFPALLKPLDAAHLDEPVERPEHQAADNHDDDRHARGPLVRGGAIRPP
jgi:hypothetical protein